MIARWKGSIPAGLRYEPMVSAMDIFGTSIAAADAITMPDRDVDGVNLLPYLQDSVEGQPHEYLFWQRGNSKAVRSSEWKLLVNEYEGENLLYNLKDNRYEYPNVAGENGKIVSQLTEELDKWTTTHAEPMWPSVIYYTVVKDGKTYYFEQ
jgi:arylsulfatase A-like enzyme